MPPVKFVAHINVETLEVTDYFYDEPGMPSELVHFGELLSQARLDDPGGPEPVMLSPGETLCLPEGVTWH